MTRGQPRLDGRARRQKTDIVGGSTGDPSPSMRAVTTCQRGPPETSWAKGSGVRPRAWRRAAGRPGFDANARFP